MKNELYNLDELRQICGDNYADIREFINLFIQTTHEAVEEIKQHRDHGDRISVSEVLHRVRPSVQIFGMETLTKEMKELEDIFRGKLQREDEEQRVRNVFEKLDLVSGMLAREAANFQ